jgi:hypothetical protein
MGAVTVFNEEARGGGDTGGGTEIARFRPFRRSFGAGLK